MKDISKLPDDLRKSLRKALKIAGDDIAKQALDKSETLAPKDTSFLSQQGRAYVNGQLVATGNLPSKGYRRVSMTDSPPTGSFSPDKLKIDITYRAGRPRKDDEPFDYAYYNRYIWGREWIETALNPRNSYFETALDNAIRSMGLV